MISRLQCTKYLQIYAPLKVFVNFSQHIEENIDEYELTENEYELTKIRAN